MAVLAELRMPGGLITVASLGLPLLLLIYWQRSGVLDDVPRRAVVVTVLLALGLAIGWVLLTGDLVIREAGSPFEAGSAGKRVLRDGLGIAEGGTILMLIPAGITRLMWRSRRDSLDGFVIGALSASVFTAAATLTRMAPQFTTAPIARSQPVQWLFFEAAVRGVTVPLTAACAGGLVGIALWFHRPRAASPFTGRKMPTTMVLVAASVLGVYAAVGWADIEGVSQLHVLLWHVAMALVALIGLRIGLQVTLLHEEAEPATDALLCACAAAMWFRRWRSARPAAPPPAPHRSDH
jgi:hypothetical protein